MCSTICLLVPLSVAAITDVRSHTIYNWTVYPGILLALAISLLATLAGRDMIQGSASDVVWLGTPDVWTALLGFLICGSIMLVCYVFFPGGLGGGDVKLLAMVGAFLGRDEGLEVMLWTFVLGGCLALVMLIWKVGALELIVRIARRIKSVITARSWLPLTDEEREPLQVRLFLSPAALVAVLIVRFGLIEHL
jgi:Flp pilus assembly protein protease CpaA